MVEFLLGEEGDGGAGAMEEREQRGSPESPDTLVTFLCYYTQGSFMINLVMRFVIKLICERP